MKTTLIILFSCLMVGTLSAQTPISLKSNGWEATGYKVSEINLALLGGAKEHVGNVGNALFVDLPTYSGGSTFSTLNYLQMNRLGPSIATAINMSISYTTTGNPTFQWFTQPGQCDPAIQFCAPPSAHLMVQTTFPGPCADGKTREWCDRWFAPVTLVFSGTSGNLTATVNLDPATWTGVEAQTGLQDPLAWSYVYKPSQITFTFGGGFFFGHGLYTTGGTARFTVNSLSVQ